MVRVVEQTEKRALTPANQNPWYVLMTLYGEQMLPSGIDGVVALSNRRA